MNGFKRLAIELGVIGLVIGLALWFAHKRGVSVIPPNTDATISIDGNRVTIDENNKHITQYAPKGTKIVINKDGSVKVISKQYGLCHEVGAGVMLEDRTVMPLINLRLAYYGRFGFNVGIGVNFRSQLSLNTFRPFAALSYALPFNALSNTSLFAGHSLVSQNWVAGVQVRF